MQLLVLSLTLFRILVAPFVFISAIFLEQYWLAFWLFILGALTDYLDGKLARALKVESQIGAILDPIGDKLLVLFSIITVMLLTQDIYVALMGSFILGREFWISALREFSAVNNMTKATAVSLTAKIKTSCQFIAISLFFLGIAADLALVIFIANFILFIALILAFKSALEYTTNLFSKSDGNK